MLGYQAKILTFAKNQAKVNFWALFGTKSTIPKKYRKSYAKALQNHLSGLFSID